MLIYTGSSPLLGQTIYIKDGDKICEAKITGVKSVQTAATNIDIETAIKLPDFICLLTIDKFVDLGDGVEAVERMDIWDFDLEKIIVNEGEF